MSETKNNTGNWNTGYRNTGDYNTGDCNTGNWNTGNWNTGYRNTGDCNTGYRNTGDCNTGNWNTGNWNTGYRNTGDYNTGDYNTGDYNTGDCNTDTPNVRIFNQNSDWNYFDKNHSKFRNIINNYQVSKCIWVFEKAMSEKEKSNNPTYKTTGGYLKVNETIYNGKEVSKEDKEFLESVPNFCPKILKECTGIVIDSKKKIIIDGEEIEISQESFEQLKKSLIK